MIRTHALAISLTVVALVAATAATAGSDDTGTTAAEDTGTTSASSMVEDSTPRMSAMSDFPVTIDSDGGTWTFDSAPERIVSLSPSATEILFAVGAGDQVVAVDEYSYYPDDAPVTDLSGFDPNLEAISSYEPNLVIVANDANDVVAGLTALDIPVLVSPAPLDIESGYAGMSELGLVTGHVDETASVITDMRTQIDDALALAPDGSVRVYHELDNTYFAASSFGFIGSVYAALGAENIADAADTDETGYPQLTEEYIIEADPQLIVITDQASYPADDVAARPGWDEIAAVRDGNIVVVDADIASRWGPRLPQFVTAAAEALAAAATVPAN